MSDFVYWNSVRDDEDVPEWARVLVLVFACLGVLVDAIGSCRVCCTSVPDAWGKDEAEASNRYTIGQKKLALAIVAAEDIPQLCMSTWITVVCKQSNMTTQYMLTVTGTVLNILRVILLSSGYLFCERRASKIMMKRNRDCVRPTAAMHRSNVQLRPRLLWRVERPGGARKMWSSALLPLKKRKLLSTQSKTSTKKRLC